MKKHLRELIISIIINAIILFFVSTFIPELGFKVISSSYWALATFFILWTIFWFLNIVIKKILKIITLPLKYLTLWLSSLIINIGMFYLFELVLRSYDIGILIQLWSILQVFLLSLTITIVYLLIKKII